MILSAISAMVLKALMSALSLLETSRRLLYIALPLESKLARPVPGPGKVTGWHLVKSRVGEQKHVNNTD